MGHPHFTFHVHNGMPIKTEYKYLFIIYFSFIVLGEIQVFVNVTLTSMLSSLFQKMYY